MKNIILTLFTLICSTGIYAQNSTEKYLKDVKSIDAIINAYYDVISGSAADPWQFERDKFIHSTKAFITRYDKNTKTGPHSLEKEYIPILMSPREAMYEIELKREVSHYGNMAQVWSAFEIRTDPKIETNIRGLNSIQLFYENDRWWIDSWTCVMESKNNAIVSEFLNN